MSNWIILEFFFYHFALNFLVKEKGITFVDVSKSVRQLQTLKLKISNVNNKGGQEYFSLILVVLTTYSRIVLDLPDEALEVVVVFPDGVFDAKALMINSRWPTNFASS